MVFKDSIFHDAQKIGSKFQYQLTQHPKVANKEKC